MANKEKKQIKNNKDKTNFFKSFKAELKKVNWPTLKQLVNSTSAVLAIVVILALTVFILDFTFESINKYGIDKVKQTIVDSKKVDEEQSTEDSEISEESEEVENNETTTETNSENEQNNEGQE